MPKERQAASDLLELIRRYVIQETVAPLKSIGRTLAYGLAGSLLVAVGLAISLLGLLRVLETETDGTFAGNWSFAPYLLTAVAGLMVAGTAVVMGLRRGRHT